MPKSNVVLLWGENPFLLREAALDALGGVRATEVEAAEWQGGETDDLATPSLFGDARALLVNDCRSLSKEGVAELARYLSNPVPDALLILSATVADRGKPPAALVKAVKPVGEVREVKLARKDLSGWMVSRGGKRGVSIAADAAQAMVEILGEDPAALDSAVEQLAGAFPNQRITREVVQRQFRGLGDQHVWDLCDRAFAKDLPGSIRALRSLLESQEAGLLILGGIASRARDLLKVRALPDRMRPEELARAAGLRFEWQGRRYRDQARRFSMEQLVRIHARIAEADRALKSGASEEIVLPVLVSSIAGEEPAA
ncbi:MAG: DNA polymerase III subunit delta [Actinomycetota bacterium]|nr:DNA polymerase III subunit delta [Actinomycetota bacterium]